MITNRLTLTFHAQIAVLTVVINALWIMPMLRFFCFISILYVLSGCLGSGDMRASGLILSADTSVSYTGNLPFPVIKDTVPPAPPIPYTGLTYVKTELLKAAPGTKSVVFNSNSSKLYAMNLEGMSIYEFDQASRKVVREFKFKPTPGTGWDYVKDKPIPSYQEKPVEACLSHGDSILWVSLHNAEGIVPIRIDSLRANRPSANEQPSKKITVVYPGSIRRDSFYVPLIATGKTPKIIAKTADNKYLLVSNWHSYNVSVLEMNKDLYPFAKMIDTIPVSSIPRGVNNNSQDGDLCVKS